MKKKILLIILPVIILLVGIIGGGYYIVNNEINIDTIYSGIKVDELDVGGMTKKEAYDLLVSEREDKIQEQSMVLQYKDKEYNISLNKLGVKYDYDRAIKEAYEKGRNGKIHQRYKTIKDIEKNGMDIPLEYDISSIKVEDVIDEIGQDIDIEPKDAKIRITGGNIEISEEQIGQKVNKESLSKAIINNIYDLKNIEVPIDMAKPRYTKDYYKRINGIIGEYKTTFVNSSESRANNIRLSSKGLDGKILHPGESMSYNEVLGPITKGRGYKDAPVIINGSLVPGVGGGICQTSTTLYNALLLADMTITERSPHSIPINYVPKGTDAAVAEGYKDLKFRNDHDFPVYINAKVVGRSVYFQIYGDRKSKDYIVRIESKIVETIKHKIKENLDPKAKPGSRELIQDGRDGYKTKTYKYKIKNGKIIETKQISSDYYRERDAIYKIGPRVSTKPKPEPKPTKPTKPTKPEQPEKPVEPKEPEDNSGSQNNKDTDND